MDRQGQHIGSELRVLQEAVASAVHELSQPLNVVNLLADNVLDDVASLQETAGGDGELIADLRRRIESIVEQAAKASDITRWVRAFAVGIGGEPTDFDPDAVIERIAGIFSNDLRVAGVELAVAPAPGTRWAMGDEALFGFALTEVVMWLTRTLAEPAEGAPADGSPARRIRIDCVDSGDPRVLSVLVRGGAVAGWRDAGDSASGATGDGVPLPSSLPLLAMLGRTAASGATLSKLAGGAMRFRLSLPMSDLPADGSLGGLR
ncbi:MAG TPA: hypothetical protein VJ890_00870 [Vineibacter sp.]|nr:hypothetical protein [Vineibacter sp.]